MAGKQTSEIADTTAERLPLLPLRDAVVFPGMVMPLLVGRPRSVDALHAAMQGGTKIFLVTQQSPATDDPGAKELYQVGVIADIPQLVQVREGVYKVLVEARCRASLQSYEQGDKHAWGMVQRHEPSATDDEKEGALSRAVLAAFEHFANLSSAVPADSYATVSGIEEPGALADRVAGHMPFSIGVRQELLEELDTLARLKHLNKYIAQEIGALQVDKRLRRRVRKQMEKSQREYYLNEQMKAIQEELGEIEGGASEAEQLETRLGKSGMPSAALKKAKSELGKFKLMSPMSAEASVLRSYLDWLVSLPWKKRTRLRQNIAYARQVLDEDHYGLEEVKTRILEYLAVQKRVRQVRGPILCLVGPPGVGKTSLGRSIARATGRKFVRLSLGGVRDEAEIRGHRRTYIGSLPGKIIQKIASAEAINPLFLMDEVDKMGMDYRGDPASALLEVLDPEQNCAFNDHYLEVDYNLSEVMFICTANSLEIPPPLLDRMEVVRIPGYTEDEKLQIANNFLLPKQMEHSGLKKGEIRFQQQALLDLIRYYTQEAGVRSLEREIAKVCRKVVLKLSETEEDDEKGKGAGKKKPVTITAKRLEDYCGVRRYSYGQGDSENRVGQVHGLAWTSTGGDLLTIEATVVPGKARQVLTGSLGDVMKESIQAAMTVVRSRADVLGIPTNFLEKRDVHVHVPEGAMPKDGPSAGICMCTALISALTGISVKSNVAMTGEITLQGRVLPVGGLKEKLLAARRANIKQVIVPEENMRNIKEVNEKILEDLDIKYVSWIDQVLDIALERPPGSLAEKGGAEENLPVALKPRRRSRTTPRPARTH